MPSTNIGLVEATAPMALDDLPAHQKNYLAYQKRSMNRIWAKTHNIIALDSSYLPRAIENILSKSIYLLTLPKKLYWGKYSAI